MVGMQDAKIKLTGSMIYYRGSSEFPKLFLNVSLHVLMNGNVHYVYIPVTRYRFFLSTSSSVEKQSKLVEVAHIWLASAVATY